VVLSVCCFGRIFRTGILIFADSTYLFKASFIFI